MDERRHVSPGGYTADYGPNVEQILAQVLADALKVATDMARVQQTAQVLEELGGSIQEAAKRLGEAQKREDDHGHR